MFLLLIYMLFGTIVGSIIGLFWGVFLTILQVIFSFWRILLPIGLIIFLWCIFTPAAKFLLLMTLVLIFILTIIIKAK